MIYVDNLAISLYKAGLQKVLITELSVGLVILESVEMLVFDEI